MILVFEKSVLEGWATTMAANGSGSVSWMVVVTRKQVPMGKYSPTKTFQPDLMTKSVLSVTEGREAY